MGECTKKDYKGNVYYIDNKVVTHTPLVCFGGFGEPRRQDLERCLKENNMAPRKTHGINNNNR